MSTLDGKIYIGDDNRTDMGVMVSRRDENIQRHDNFCYWVRVSEGLEILHGVYEGKSLHHERDTDTIS